MIKQFPRLNRPNITNPASIEIVGEMVFLKPSHIRKKLTLPHFIDPRGNIEREKVEKEMTSGKNIEMAKTLGFHEEKIRNVLEQRFKECNENFLSFYDMLDALMVATDPPSQK